MLIIPQLYIRNKKSVALERTITPLYDEDPFAMAMRIKDARGEAVYIIDLGVPHVGSSENAPLISKIKDETGLTVLIGGAFRSIRSIEAYLTMGLKMVILETVAYQQPTLVSDACKHFPDGIAVSINVQAGRVTIPGWTVAANKTALDYAEQFGELGVKTFFYSDIGSDGFMGNDNFENILLFCKKVRRQVIITSDIHGSSDIEKLTTLGAPGLDGLILARALYEGRVDLNGAIGLVTDLSAASSNDPTMQEE